MANSPLILIYDGKLPKYGYNFLNFNSLNINCNIYLICETKTLNKKKLNSSINIFDLDKYNTNLYEFNTHKKQDYYKWRKGFWIKTINRFFIINEFTKSNKINSFFIGELDNIFFDLDQLEKKLNQFKYDIHIPFDYEEKKCIGSLIHFKNQIKLNKLCSFIKEEIKATFKNDMILLYNFSQKYKEEVNFFPNLFNSKDSKMINELNGYVDSASIGQYLFGTDPRNTFGFLYNKEIKLKNNSEKICFFYKSQRFFIYFNNKEIKLYNLHIHSKLNDFLFKEEKIKLILSNINQGKKTLMSFNVQSSLIIILLNLYFPMFNMMFKFLKKIIFLK